MKKVKLLTSLSALTVASATVPVFTTSCSEQFNFDGEYSEEDVLPTGREYDNDWINSYFKINNQNWTTPTNPKMDNGYDDESAIEYLNENLKSVKQFVGCLIYSLMWTYYEIKTGTDPVRIKISDSDFVYNHNSKTFSFQFTFSLFSYTYFEYIPNFKIRSRSYESLKILQVCDYDKYTNSFTIGHSYNKDQHFIDFGLEISIFNGVNFPDWQDLNSLNVETKDYVDGIAYLYVPKTLFPTAEFKKNKIDVWMYDRFYTKDYITPDSEDNVLKFYQFDEEYSEIFLYPIVLNINGVVSLMNEFFKISVAVEDNINNKYAIVYAIGSIFGIEPKKDLVNTEKKLTFTISFGSELSMNSDFIVTMVPHDTGELTSK